jgi:hypothetical protein
MRKRLILAGGRNFTGLAAVAGALAHFAPSGPHVLVHGACKTFEEDGSPYELKRLGDGKLEAPGADRLAHFMALSLGWDVEPHPARWSKHGKAAGPLRNQYMARLGAHGLIAFPGGRGTRTMIDAAREAGIPLWEPLRSRTRLSPDQLA